MQFTPVQRKIMQGAPPQPFGQYYSSSGGQRVSCFQFSMYTKFPYASYSDNVHTQCVNDSRYIQFQTIFFIFFHLL